MLGWKVLLSVALLTILLCGCGGGQVEPPPTAAPQLAATLPRSGKGYELYSWKSGGTWHFTLITGTNRLKTLDEITAPENIEEGEWVKITVEGVPALKSTLGRLPSGTMVFWHNARRLDPGPRESGPNVRLPPVWLFREVRSHCTELGLTLERTR